MFKIVFWKKKSFERKKLINMKKKNANALNEFKNYNKHELFSWIMKKKYEKETGTEMNINWKKSASNAKFRQNYKFETFFSSEDNTGIENEFEGKKNKQNFKKFYKLIKKDDHHYDHY